MNDLLTIINVLNEDQQAEFVKYLERLNRRSDTKNVQLFKLLAKGDSQGLDHKLYGKANRNAFYVLCNRLQHRLVDFLAQSSFATETSAEMNCLKLLLASRIFFEQKQHKVGFKTLRKALDAAAELEAYSILNEIYHTYIQYSHLQTDLPLEELLKQAEANNALYNQELKVNTLYAQLRMNRLDNSQEAFSLQIDHLLAGFNLKLDKNLSYKALYQLMSLAVEAAQNSQNYYEILDFTRQLYTIIESKSELKGRYIFYRIQASYLMANVLFRNKLLAESQKITTELLGKLSMYPNYSAVVKKRIELLQSLNLFYTGKPEQAIQLLLRAGKGDLQIELSLAMIYFQQEAYDKAYRLFIKWNHSDKWYEKKLGWQWVVQKNIMEILLLIERDQLELVLSRMESFSRRFNAFLRQQKQERVVQFMQFVDQIYKNPEIAKTSEFIENVEARLTQKNPVEEDIFVMSFYAWLKSKMTGKPLYGTTLELIQTHGN